MPHISSGIVVHDVDSAFEGSSLIECQSMMIEIIPFKEMIFHVNLFLYSEMAF